MITLGAAFAVLLMGPRFQKVVPLDGYARFWVKGVTHPLAGYEYRGPAKGPLYRQKEGESARTGMVRRQCGGDFSKIRGHCPTFLEHCPKNRGQCPKDWAIAPKFSGVAPKNGRRALKLSSLGAGCTYHAISTLQGKIGQFLMIFEPNSRISGQNHGILAGERGFRGKSGHFSVHFRCFGK